MLAQISDGKLQWGGFFDIFAGLKEINVDKYKGVIESFKDLDLSLSKYKNYDTGKANWDKIAKSIKGCNETSLSYFKTLEDGNGVIDNQAASVEGLSDFLKKEGGSAEIAAAKTALLNAALNAGIILAVSLALKGLTWVIDNIIPSAEKCKEKVDEAMSSYQSTISTLNDNAKAISELTGRYDELSKGVGKLGNNISLTEDEFEEYHNITSKIAEICPSLVEGWDAQGNAIVNLTDIVKEFNAEYEKSLHNANLTLMESKDDIFKNYKNTIKGINKVLGYAEEALEIIRSGESLYDKIYDYQGFETSDYDKFVRKLGLSRDDIVNGNYDAIKKQVILKINSLKEEIENAAQDVTPLLKAYLSEDANYQLIEDDDLKKALSLFVDNLPSSLVTAIVNNGASAGSDFIGGFVKAVKEDTNAQKAILQLFILDLSKISPNEAKDTVDNYISTLSVILKALDYKIDPIELKVFFGFEDIDTIARNYNVVIDRAVAKFNGINVIYYDDNTTRRTSNVIRSRFNSNEESETYTALEALEQERASIEAFMEENSINTQDKIALLNKCIEKSKTWEEATKKYLASALDDTLVPSFSDIFAIKDAEGNLNTLGELTEQLDKIKSAYSNLKNAMDSYSSTGSITIEQFQSIIEQGDDFLDYLTLEDGQLGINEQAMYDLAKARIAEMKAQAIQGVVDNVSKIKTEADADSYLASTNYDLADSYHTLAEAQLIAWSTSALEKGLSQDYVDKVTNKARNDINKIRALVNKVDFKNFSGASSSSAAEQAEKDWKNVLDKETDLLEKQLAANVITFKEYTDKRRQIIEDYYRDGKIKAEEYYDALESMYNHQLSLYDRVVNAVTDRIDEEIDKLNEQKEAIENSYQVKIDAIQEEIDALNKANDARQEQIDLEKAQYEAERARNQRVNKVYNGSQFVYKADMDAVRDAEDDLADKEFQLNISRLETQIELLKEEMENATKSLDNQIDALEAYKDKWNEISDIYQKQQDKLLAAEIMGSEWERDILNGRLDTLRSFTEQYIALQQAQIDIAAKAAKIRAEDEAGNAETPKKTPGGSPDDTPDDDDTPKKTPIKVSGKSSFYVKKYEYASGTDHARKGLNLVGEDGTETFIDNDGNIALVTKPTLIPMEGGEVVKNAEETKAMLDMGNIEPVQSKNVKALYDHIRNLPPSAFDFQSLMQQPLSAMVNFPNMDYSHMLHNTSAEHNIVHIDNNNVSINCPNVTNNSGAEYIMKEFRRLPLDTIQYMHRRNK